MKQNVLFICAIISLCFFQVELSASTQSQIDSVKLLLKNASGPNDQIEQLNELAIQFNGLNRDSSFYYMEKSFELATRVNNKSKIARAQNNIAYYFMTAGALDTARVLLHQVFSYLDKNQDDYVKTRAYNNLGVINYQEGDYDSCIVNFQIALEAAEKIEDKSRMALLYYNVGDVLGSNSLLKEAMLNLRKSAKIATDIDDYRIAAAAYGGIGNLFQFENYLDSAAVYHKLSLEFAEKSNAVDMLYRAYWAIGLLEDKKGNHKEAIAFIKKSREQLVAMNATAYLGHCDCLLGKAYGGLGNFTKSELHFQSFEQHPQKAGNYAATHECYLYWYESRIAAGDYKAANEYLHIYMEMNDSMFTIEHKLNLAELETKYQTAKKEKEIAQQQLQLKNKNSQNIFLLGGLLLTLALLGFTYFIYQQRLRFKEQKLTTLKKEQELNSFKAMIEGEEKERVRVARDLHDGIGALLGSLSMKMSGLKEENTALQDSKRFGEIISGIDNTADEVRRISHNLMPAVLLKFGLIKALEEHFARINQSNLMNIEFQHYGVDDRISQRVELVIYRVIQELINNIIKYADANNAIVQLNRNNGTLALTIEDDGKGLNWQKDGNNKGIGIDNLESRLASLQGEMDIDAQANVGTSVYIQIELDKTK